MFYQEIFFSKASKSMALCCVGLSTSGTLSPTAAHGLHIHPVGSATFITRISISKDVVLRHIMRTLLTALPSAYDEN